MAKSELFQFSWFHNFDNSINELAALAMKENWGESSKKPILKNYLNHTFKRIKYENSKIAFCDDQRYSCFNTGLCTDNQEDIYAFFNKNKKSSSSIQWYFLGFKKSSQKDLTKFTQLPGRAHYFDNPSDLLYDTRLELRYNADHIIDDNLPRFPETLQRSDKQLLINILEGAISDARRRIERNYKTAIPQFYGGHIQLLLPLCMLSKAKADLALVVQKQNTDVYLASTVLTLKMAYNNARLIARPDTEWLTP